MSADRCPWTGATILPEVAYTIATGRLFCELDDLYDAAEDLLGYRPLTHELSEDRIWSDMQKAFERRAAERYLAADE